MTEQGPRRNPVEELADEFLLRYRRGERPSLTEYARAHPELADEIRDVFPALVLMEEAGPRKADLPGPCPGGLTAGGANLERLGDYRILREVGRGGMGLVYEAEQEALGRHVALKVLPPQTAVEPVRLRRFLREAKAAARLHHTNIVPVFDIGECQGVHYYAMQFIQGQGLDEVLLELRRMRAGKAPAGAGAPAGSDLSASLARSLLSGQFGREAPPPPDCPPEGRPGDRPEQGSSTSAILSGSPDFSTQSDYHYYRSVARLGLQVAEALAYAHGQKVLHRDIKPSNLLLDRHGAVWVTDFGLAKDEGEDLTRTGDVVGTLRYMAPERFSGRSDPRSDVYGLGVTLYELLTLRPAFDESDRARLVQRLTHEEPARPRKLDPHVPRDLETVVLKAIEKEPPRRYQTAQDLAEDLRRFLADLPIRARRASPAERGWRWCRRNPALASMIAVAALLLLALAVGSSVAAVRLGEERNRALAGWGRAEEQQRRAEDAERGVKDQLWRSYLAQAEATRLSGLAGRRFDSLEALDRALELVRALGVEPRHRPALRDEFIACLALPDLRPAKMRKVSLPRLHAVAFDPPLERYAFNDDKGAITVRRVADDRELLRLPGAGGPAHQLLFSPDGRLLAARDHNPFALAGRLRVWDLSRGKTILRVSFPVPHVAFDFSPDGRWLAAGEADGSIRLYDLLRGREARRLGKGITPFHLAFHPGGRKLAVSGGWETRLVQIRDVKTGEVTGSLDHPAPVQGVAWGPDGRLLAAACGWQVALWEAEAGRRVGLWEGHESRVVAVAFSPRGDLLASSSWDDLVYLWDVPTGRPLHRSSGGAPSLRFSPDGRYLASTLDGLRLGLWEVSAGRECRVLGGRGGLTDPLTGIDFSPDGRLLAAAGPGGVHLWDPASGKEVATLPAGESWAVAFTRDARGRARGLLVTGRAGLQRWPITPAAVGPPVAGARPGAVKVGPPQALWTDGALGRLSLSTDGRVLAAGPWSAATSQGVILGLGGPARDPAPVVHPGLAFVAMSPDGLRIATGAFSGVGVKVWDARGGGLLRELSNEEGTNVAFSPDGRTLVTSTREECRFWDVSSWRSRRVLGREEAGGIPGHIAFSPDGKLLALTLSRRLVVLVDPATGRRLATLEAPSRQQVWALSFSPDGGLLAVACANGQVQLWDLRRVREQLAARGLDCDLPPYPPAGAGEDVGPLAVQVLTEKPRPEGKGPPPGTRE